MKSIRLWLSAALVMGAVTTHVTDANADGIAATTASVPAASRASLQQAISAYRAAHPEAFAAVLGVKGHLPEGYQDRRNPIPEVTRELRDLGPSALLPMLNVLAFEAPARANATDAEWSALTVGLLEAVGSIRDPQSGPVLRAVHESGTTDARVLRAAAEAMGRLCGAAEQQALIGHTAARDPLLASSIYGLGQCRTEASAKALSALAQKNLGDDMGVAIAAALGSIGSSWAWHSRGPAAQAQGDAVRAIAADGLFAALLSGSAATQLQAGKALLMVEHPGTAERAAKARTTANDATKAAIDKLTRGLERKARR